MDIPGYYGRTHLVASGPEDAPPLVLLHGAMASLIMWAANVADLSQDYRVYAVDVIGEASKSIPARPRQTREDCVAWLSELLYALEIEKTDMVGMSYGGWLTLNYAIGAPERLKRIELLSPPGSFAPLAKQFMVRLLLAVYLRRRFLVESFVGWVTHEDALRDPTTRAICLDEMIDQIYLGLKHLRMPGEAPPVVFSDEELRGVLVPTLLLIGEQKVIYDPKAALERGRRLIVTAGA